MNSYSTQRREWLRETLGPHYSEDEVSFDKNFEYFDTKDAVVWIDPLDGTSDFIKNNLPAVTVLIGLSIKNKSRIGIVHNPFSEDDNSVGKTIYGTAEHGVFKVNYSKALSTDEACDRPQEYLEPFDASAPALLHSIKVAASLQHFSP